MHAYNLMLLSGTATVQLALILFFIDDKDIQGLWRLNR